MPSIRFSRRAREDLLVLWEYIEGASGARAADRIYDRIHKACERLRDNPRLGRPRSEIAGDARSIVIDRWVAFYRIVDDETVQIVRIVDGARDLKQIDMTGR